MRVHDVMRKQVRTILPSAPVSMARELFRRYEIRHLVVLEAKAVVGVLADRDLLDLADGDAQVKRVMAHPAVTISPDETVRKAAGLMTGHGIGALPVIEESKLVGIVTSSDLLELLAKGTVNPAPNRERPLLARRSPKRKRVSV
jgi:acetoin utilization protein AcuB